MKKLMVAFLLFTSIDTFALTQSSSQINIERASGMFGCMVRYKTFVDGNYVGKLGMRGSLTVPVMPGRHLVQIKTLEKVLEQEISVAPHHIYDVTVSQNIHYTSKDFLISAAGAVVAAKTGVGFYSTGSKTDEIRVNPAS